MYKSKKLSIVIPIYNESKNIQILVQEIMDSIKNIEYEIIIVNDGSEDDTGAQLINLSRLSSVKIINHQKNLGQSKSILTGINEASFDTIVTIDGDCQNNPNDINNLFMIYSSDSKLKLVGGIRTHRRDSIVKIFSSKIANQFRAYFLKDNCKDTGCSLKIFDKKIFLSFTFFDGIHRFLPALFLGYGYQTQFVPVDHRSRKFGKTKYGTWERLIKGIRDMLEVRKIIREKNKYN